MRRRSEPYLVRFMIRSRTTISSKIGEEKVRLLRSRSKIFMIRSRTALSGKIVDVEEKKYTLG
jgi:hypothetical protein